MIQEIKFSKYVKKIKKGNKVILCNTKYGGWLKLSSECYDILCNAEKEHLKKGVFFAALYDDDDRNYFEKIIRYLEDIYILETDEVYNNNLNVTFAITNRCNLQCKHCSADAVTLKEPEAMSTEEVFRAIDKLVECKPNLLCITGGEPLARDDFYEIVKYIRSRYQGLLELMTNGLLINESNIKEIINNFNSVDISLDGYDEYSCAKVRGKGVFQKVIDTVKLFKSYNYDKISLSMVRDKYTYNKTDEFYKLVDSLGIKGITRLYAPLGRGEDNKEELAKIDNDEEKSVNKDDVYGLTIDDLDCIVEMNSSEDKKVFGRACGALKDQFYLGADGYIYPCGAGSIEEFKLDSISEIDNIEKYIREEQYKKHSNYKNISGIMPENVEKCMDCNVNDFCVGCPLYLYLYRKSGVYSNFCDERKPIFKRMIWGE